MLVPVRCFTCGNLISDKFEEYRETMQQSGSQSPDEAMSALGIERYCCRRMLLTTVETIEQIIPFYEAMHRRKTEIQTEME